MKHSHWLFTPAFVAAATLAGGAAAAADRTEASTLIIHVSDSAQVPRDVLCRAERMMTKIYGRIGVNAVWINQVSQAAHQPSDRAVSDDDGLHVVVLLPSAAATEQMGRPNGILGFAPRLTPEVSGRLAYVFYDRARELARSGNVDISTLIAHVLAHEIGHVLLPYGSHSLTGIMRGRWDTAQLRAAEQVALSFTDDQVKLIRATLSDRRLQAESASSVVPH